MTTTIDVPARGRRWVLGALVRDRTSNVLYRVASRPIRYHEEALPMQRVAKVRDVPADWQAVQRLLAIMQTVRSTGRLTPESRGALSCPAEQVAPPPEAEIGAPTAKWTAREDAQSLAQYPYLTVQGDVLTIVKPIYDDAPVVAWLQDAALAEEARALIATGARLERYPAVNVRRAGG